MILSISNVSNQEIDEIEGNFLADDVVLTGSIECQGELITEGVINGSIVSTGKLTVSEGAVVDGDIEGHTMDLHGEIRGDVKISEICVIKNSAKLEGDLAAKKISIEEGAVFEGKFSVGK